MEGLNIVLFSIELPPLFNSEVNATESKQVLKEVEKKMRSYPFKFKEAAILSGQEEGAYGWVTVNYLLENFAKVSTFSVQQKEGH